MCALSRALDKAGSFLNRAIFVELVETGVGIGLQDAAELRQMPLRMFSLAIRRVSEPRCGSGHQARGTVIADVDPEPCRFRPAVAGSEHRKRRVVAMQLVGGHHVAASASTSGFSMGPYGAG